MLLQYIASLLALCLFINSNFSLKHLLSLKIKLLVNWSALSSKEGWFSHPFLRPSITYYFLLLTLQFNLFNKEFRACLGYEFYDISFSIFWVFQLNAASVLHILLAQWNKAFIHAIYMGHGVRVRQCDYLVCVGL